MTAGLFSSLPLSPLSALCPHFPTLQMKTNVPPYVKGWICVLCYYKYMHKYYKIQAVPLLYGSQLCLPVILQCIPECCVWVVGYLLVQCSTHRVKRHSFIHSSLLRRAKIFFYLKNFFYIFWLF